MRRLEHVERLAGQQVVAHREHLDELQERAAQLRRAFDDPLRILDMSFEQLAIARAGVEKRPPQRGPQVAVPDLRRELAHFHRAPRAAGGEIAFRHQLVVLQSHAIDQRRRQRRAESIVDIHHRDAAGTGVQHPEQRRDTAERGAIADAGRHRDDRLVEQPRDDRGQRAFHSGDHDEHARRA